MAIILRKTEPIKTEPKKKRSELNGNIIFSTTWCCTCKYKHRFSSTDYVQQFNIALTRTPFMIDGMTDV